MLSSLATVSEFFSGGGQTSNGQINEVSINDIKSRAGMLKYLENSISSLQSCIGANLNSHNAMCGELNKTFAALLNASAGKKSDMLNSA
jgi:hypothetical protein